MTNQTLIEAILESPTRRKAVEYLIEMLLDHERLNRLNGRYEVVIVGRQISSAFYKHYRTETLPERTGAKCVDRADEIAEMR